MADRYPLIIDPSSNQIKELPSGDGLDLTGTKISSITDINATGIITAAQFSGPITGTISGNATGLTGVPNIVVADITANNISVAGTVTYNDVTSVDSVGIITARNGLAVTGGTATFTNSIDANGGLDVDGQTDLDNVSISGVVTSTSTIAAARFDGEVNSLKFDTTTTGVVVSGIATADNFKTGFSNVHSVGFDVVSSTGAGSTIRESGNAVFSGIVTATTVSVGGSITAGNKFYGDGSQLTGIDASAVQTGTTKVQTAATTIVNQVSGSGIGTFTSDGLNVTGVVTATSFEGSGSQLTGIDATALKDSSGNTKVQANSTGAVVTGVLTATTFSGSGSGLTGVPSQADVDTLTANIAVLGFKVAVNGSLTKYSLVDQVIDEYVDASGIDAGASTNENVQGSGAGKYYRGWSGSGGSQSYNQTYTYTGSDTTISIANGQLVNGTAKVWGAAGGQDGNSSGSNHYGGGGAFVNSTLNYTSDGTDLIISVGQGGQHGVIGGNGGSGGGYSGIFLGSKTHANALLVAGAGGGCGDNGGTHGGVGGGFGTAGNGGGTNYGSGATQNAGGAKGTGANESVPGTNGSALTGGHGGANRARQESAMYNGGGIQGEEPGGYMGGGGGGGGYYGGGGGGGGNSGAGGGGGSSYYKTTGSYFSGTPSSAAGSGANAGGNTDPNYTSGIGQGSSASGSAAADGGHGAVYLDITVSAEEPDDLTLQSTDTTASSAPTKADLVMLIEDGIGTATINTDIKAYISRDSGTTWTQGTLVDEGTWGTNKKVLAFHNLDISGQPSGTAMAYKITTHNQSTAKNTYIHATSYGWS